MPTDLNFVEYVMIQASEAGQMTYKRMFGEYGIYCNAKLVGLICDNILYIKNTTQGVRVCPGLEMASPYKNAKPHLVFDDVDDSETLSHLIKATYEELPEPTPKKVR